jgi:hypothetical protein
MSRRVRQPETKEARRKNNPPSSSIHQSPHISHSSTSPHITIKFSSSFIHHPSTMPNAILVDNSPRSTSFRPKPLPLPNPTAKDVSADHPVNADPSQFYAKFHAGKDSAVLHPDNYALFGLSAASHQDVISNNNKRKAWFAFK